VTVPVQEQIGPFTIYGPDPQAAQLEGFTISFRGRPVPGVYADRDAAIFACGYVLGGEQYGPTDDAMDYRATEEGRWVIMTDLTWLQENSEQLDAEGFAPLGMPDNLKRFGQGD
jgi:hypothetical protein